MEPGFGIWEGVGWLFVEAVAERQRHNFSSFSHLLQEAAQLLVVLAVCNVWPEGKM